MANIKKNTKTGLWWVRLSLGTDKCGKRIQSYYSNKRKQEVEFWIAEQVAARKDGSIRKVIQIRTMEQLFAVWLEDHVRLTKATTTYPDVVHATEGRPGRTDARPTSPRRLAPGRLEGLDDQFTTRHLRRHVQLGDPDE
ncbi:hypothetical protein [Exiguobacterium antarcticum]|uniref:hypothetical protein n=1 Tax=Exiguobacterium antarcticum TaxID=132920 RepID=UPI00059DD834|nr:hypothetical protein [Exiguobacterium antarcticum]